DALRGGPAAVVGAGAIHGVDDLVDVLGAGLHGGPDLVEPAPSVLTQPSEHRPRVVQSGPVAGCDPLHPTGIDELHEEIQGPEIVPEVAASGVAGVCRDD